MGDPMRIETRKIEHTTYGPTSIPVWAVTFAIMSDGGYDTLSTVYVLGLSHRDVASVDQEARKELHRISSQIAAAGAGTPTEPTERPSGESERERKWREGQSQGSGWAV